MNAKDYLRFAAEERRVRRATEAVIAFAAIVVALIIVAFALFSLTK